MTQKELIKAVAADVNARGNVKVTEACTGEVIKSFTHVAGEAMKKGEQIQLAGFGTFQAVNKPAHEGRNPATGATIQIPARLAPKFKASKTLKDLLNN